MDLKPNDYEPNDYGYLPYDNFEVLQNQHGALIGRFNSLFEKFFEKNDITYTVKIKMGMENYKPTIYDINCRLRMGDAIKYVSEVVLERHGRRFFIGTGQFINSKPESELMAIIKSSDLFNDFKPKNIVETPSQTSENNIPDLIALSRGSFTIIWNGKPITVHKIGNHILVHKDDWNEMIYGKAVSCMTDRNILDNSDRVNFGLDLDT